MSGRPRILFVASALQAVGGIPHYAKATISSLERVADVEVLDLTLSGSRADQVRGFVRAVTRLARRPDLVVLAHVGFGPIGAVARLLGCRWVVIAYGIEVWGPPSWSITTTLRRATRVWPISSWTATEVLRTAPGSRLGPVLGGNISDRFFQEHETVDGPFRALLVSRLEDLRYKGHATVIDAMQQVVAEHPDRPVELRIAGGGRSAGELAELVRARDRAGVVRVLGRISDDELLEEYRRADVLCLVSEFERGPTPRGEGLGLVILEAGAAGTPAVGSSIGGSVDVIVDGETGFLIEPRRPDLAAARIGELLDDRARARALGEAARRFARAEHSLDAFAERVALAVDDVMGEGGH